MAGSWGGPWPIWWAMWWIIPLGLFALWFLSHRRGGWRGHWAGGPPLPSREHALAILQERFAKGEIDDDEYLRRRSTLEAL